MASGVTEQSGEYLTSVEYGHKEEYLSPDNSNERLIQLYTRRARNYLNWYESSLMYMAHIVTENDS